MIYSLFKLSASKMRGNLDLLKEVIFQMRSFQGYFLFKIDKTLRISFSRTFGLAVLLN